ncbi:MAG: sensor histidine kinase [Candidatus Dormibacteria bacterium]|jgi:two-component system NarL family sensor kinase
MILMAANRPRTRVAGSERDEYQLGIFRAQELERRQLANRIHEDSLQTLSHIRRLLRQAADGALAPDEMAEISREGARLAATVGDHLQLIARDLHPSVLDDFGLAAALRQLAADTTLRGTVTVHFTVQGDSERWDPDLESGCYRIAQEALRNVEEHAAATRVDMRLVCSGYGLRLLVADDGSGFPDHPRSGGTGGFGLATMRQRSRAMGGSLRIRSASPGGTVLRLSVPYRQSSSGPAPN